MSHNTTDPKVLEAMRKHYAKLKEEQAEKPFSCPEFKPTCKAWCGIGCCTSGTNA